MHKLYTVLLAVVCALGVSRTPCRSQEIYLSLERALELCLQVHPELQAAQQHIQEARAAAWYTWSPENPSLSVEYEGVPKGGGVDAAGARKLKVSQQLAFPTNMIAAGKAASLVIRQKQYEYDAVALEIISRVKTAYWQLAAEQRHYRLATQNAALADDFLEKARRRYEVGEAAKLEYIKARVEKARAENTLTRTENTVHVVRAHLNTLLMREADTPVVLTDSLEYIPFTVERDALAKSALELHPLLARARVASRRAKTERTLAWGSFLPNLELKYFEHTIEGV